MQIAKLEFRGNGCFTQWAGFDEIAPINVVIGRNNTGKSRLLDLARLCCERTLKSPAGVELRCTGTLEEGLLRRFFAESHAGGDLHGNHWRDHGAHLVGARAYWEYRSGSTEPHEVTIDPTSPGATVFQRLPQGRVGSIAAVLGGAEPPLAGKTFRHLLADRDIQPESASVSVSLEPDGKGATNVIRRLLTSAQPDMPRELVQDTLRNALNDVFGSDGYFDEIAVQVHDGEGSPGLWEVYLLEKRKGLIQLSRSGSGLKTVLLVLLNLLVLPRLKGSPPSSYVFAFEELENNLHPSLLRRLLTFVHKFVKDSGATVFLTTHAGAALDIFGVASDARIVHVSHDGESARCAAVDGHFGRLGVLGELGARPSDILQANGIVWVEGPSDAVYLNHWIGLMSSGALVEGTHYLCACYGGALLANMQFASPEVAEDELINLLRLNANVVVVCDSDKRSKAAALKKRVQRIRDELAIVPGAIVWITQPKEIENYLTGEVLAKALGIAKTIPNPGEFEQFFPGSDSKKPSFVRDVLKRGGVNKVDLALKCNLNTDLSALSGRFDWEKQVKSLVSAIQKWNA